MDQRHTILVNVDDEPAARLLRQGLALLLHEGADSAAIADLAATVVDAAPVLRANQEGKHTQVVFEYQAGECVEIFEKETRKHLRRRRRRPA